MIKKMCMVIIVVLCLTSISYSQDVCSSVGLLAQEIMTRRQTDTDIDTMMIYVNNFPLDENFTKKESETFRTLLRNLTIDAYSRPFYNTNEFKKDAIKRFKNSIMVECYKTL